MKVLIAEDDTDIQKTYKIALEERGHEVAVAENGEQCLGIYCDELNYNTQSSSLSTHTYRADDNDKHSDSNYNKALRLSSQSAVVSGFDAVVLDYRMPRKDGLQVAKEILDLNPNQRIIFASAYVQETLEESVQKLKRVVELLQKPFDIDTLVDTIEDKEAFEGLKKLMVEFKKISRDKTNDADLTHDQIKGLFESLRKIQKGRSFMYFFLSVSTSIIILCSMEPLA